MRREICATAREASQVRLISQLGVVALHLQHLICSIEADSRTCPCCLQSATIRDARCPAMCWIEVASKEPAPYRLLTTSRCNKVRSVIYAHFILDSLLTRKCVVSR